MPLTSPQVQYAPIPLQGAAGQSAVVAAAGAGLRIYVLGWCASLSAAGTLKFQSGNTDLTGAMSVGAAPVSGSAGGLPVFATAANTALNITSTVGLAAGYVAYTVSQ